VRLFKAKVLRQLAYLSHGANARSHLLTQTLGLENKVVVPRLIPPQAQFIVADPRNTVDYFRVRIDPEKSGKTDKVVQLDFTDGKKPSVGLHIRRAVVEYLPKPEEYSREADITLALSGETWAKIFLSQENVADLISKGEIKVTKGNGKEAARLFDLFDRYKPEKALLIAPHLHD